MCRLCLNYMFFGILMRGGFYELVTFFANYLKTVDSRDEELGNKIEN